MLTKSEENYIKAIYQLSENSTEPINTNLLAEQMQTKPSSATDMLKKLSEKALVQYTKYQGCSLTPTGRQTALMIIRKHRLWETFLVEKLQFGWEEVHEIAEQLEHIQSNKLTEKLDAFLEFPKFDPHGDPIPNSEGNLPTQKSVSLSTCEVGDNVIISGVKDGEAEFLSYLNEIGCTLGTELVIHNKFNFDGSFLVELNSRQIQFSAVIAKRITVIQNQ